MWQDLVDKPLPVLRAAITEDGVRRYCKAIGKPWDGTVPWFYLAHVGADQAPPTRPDMLSGRAALYPLPGSFTRTLVGGMKWKFGVRPRLGDELSIEARYTSFKETHGQSSGTMIISHLEITFTNDRNERLAVQTLIRIHR
jgi:hypothetical protein